MSDIPSLPDGFSKVNMIGEAPKLPKGFSMPGTQEKKERIYSYLDDPEEIESKIELSKLLAEVYRHDPDTVFNNISSYKKATFGKDESSKNVFQNFQDLYRANMLQTRIYELRAEQVYGNDTPEIEQRIKELESKLPNVSRIYENTPTSIVREFIEAEGNLFERISTAISEHREEKAELKAEGNLPGFFERSLYAVADVLPSQVKAASEGLKWGVNTANSFAAGALVLGQLGPQALVPEEALTVPTTWLTGLAQGFKAGSMKEMTELETGAAYDRLLKLETENGEKLDPTFTKIASAGTGIIAGGLEALQLKGLLKHTGLKKLVGEAAAETLNRQKVLQGIGGVIADTTKKHGKFVAKEGLQEVAQDSTHFFGETLVKNVNNKVKGTEFEQEWEELAPQLWRTWKNSVMAFNLMGLPGTARTFVSQGTEQAAQKRETAQGDEVVEEGVSEEQGKERDVEEETEQIPTERAIKILRQQGLADIEIEEAIKGWAGENSQRYKEAMQFFQQESLENILPQSKEELVSALGDWGSEMLHSKKGIKQDTKMNEMGLSGLWKAAALSAAGKGTIKDSLSNRLLKEIENNPDKYKRVFAYMLGDEHAIMALEGEEVFEGFEAGTQDWFAKRLWEFFPNLDDEQLEASMSLIEARAETLGMTADEYIQENIAGFTKRKPEGALAQEKAWHGTPHEVDRFTTEKTGTGEGAAAFGWGLYFTSEEQIARYYANALTQEKEGVPRIIPPDEWIQKPDDDVAYMLGKVEMKMDAREMTLPQAVKSVEGDLITTRDAGQITNEEKQTYNQVLKKIEQAHESGDLRVEGGVAGKRNLYQTTLFKDREANWLDWDNEVTKEQGERIVEEIEIEAQDKADAGEIGAQRLFAEAEEVSRAIEQGKADGELVYKDIVNAFENIYQDTIDDYVERIQKHERNKEFDHAEELTQEMEAWDAKYDPMKEASMLLNRLGIDGIRYPAGTLSGQESDAVNYVVFDENAVQIDEHIRYQKTKEGFAKAAVGITDEGKALIYASRQADFSSFVHEMGHVFENEMNEEERGEFRKWLGLKEGQEWTREAREKFADGFEQYLREGKAPNSKIADLFDRFKEWLQNIYDRFAKYKMPKNVRKAYESLITPDPKKAAQELEQAWEAQKDLWFGNKDERMQKARSEALRFQSEIKALTGVKAYRQYNQRARDIDQAIHVSIDLKNNPQHVEQFYDQLTERQKKIVDLAQNLPEEFQDIADRIEQSYKELGLEALDEEVIYNVRENYVARKWNLKGKEKSELFRKFGTKTSHRKARVFETILEGWANGYELSIKGATNNLVALKEHIIQTIEDKKFLRALQGIKLQEGSPLVTTRQFEGYKEIEHPNFFVWKWAGQAEEGESYGKNFFITEDGVLFEKQRLFAPEEQADELNRILGHSKLREAGGKAEQALHAITRFNAHVKAWVLQSSFFHHMAFMRSYYLGTSRKTWQEMNVFKARSLGLEAIKNDDPLILHGVRNGLTLGVMQDWQESLLHEQTKIGQMFGKIPGGEKAQQYVSRFREAQARRLFEIFGAGLKAKAFMIEYRNHTKKHPNLDPDTAAKHVAELINDDFGGLHLQRMGRSPTMQHLFRLFILAPDWTESNVNTMRKAFKRGEQGQLYRKFWAGILLKGLSVTVLANFLLAGGDLDEFLENYQKALESETGEGTNIDVKKMTSIDITPLYQLLGGDTERRKYFNIMGHFMDPFKFIIQPFKSLHHKGSMIYGMFHEAMSGVDWAGRKFTSFPELLQTGKTVEWDYGGKTIDWSQLPSYILNTLIGMQPIQIQNLLAYLSGETEAFDAISRSMGIHTSTTYGEPEEETTPFY
jgi:hypothetical protein